MANPPTASQAAIKARSGQTSNLQEWQLADGTPIAFITPAGDFEFALNGVGLILRSPNGTRYRIAVNDAGGLERTSL